MLKEVGLRPPGIHTLLPYQDVALLSPEDSDRLGDLSSTRSFLCIDRVKIFTDGSLGAATAAINVSVRKCECGYLKVQSLTNILCIGWMCRLLMQTMRQRTRPGTPSRRSSSQVTSWRGQWRRRKPPVRRPVSARTPPHSVSTNRWCVCLSCCLCV
jgi:hypothetical protein